MNTTEKIAQLRQELAELEAQERAEKEEARKKANAERDAKLDSIKNAISEYNKEYGGSLALAIKKESKIGDPIWHEFFPWL